MPLPFLDRSDRRMIRRLLDGDPATIDTLLGWIRGAMTPYRRQLSNESEDMEQEVFIALSEALSEGRFRAQSSLRTYVRALTHHRCIDRLRAIGRRQWVDISELELEDPEPTPDDALLEAESVHVTFKVVEQMPEGCRELWNLLQKGLSYREMSARTGVAEGALRVRMLRCRKRAVELRDQLSRSTCNESPDRTTR